jgi:hypothetical protein
MRRSDGQGWRGDCRAARRRRATSLGLHAVARDSQRRRVVKLEQDLLGVLLAELIESERSARRQLPKRARRLGAGEGPAEAMLRVARHAERTRAELERFCGSWRQRARKTLERAVATMRERFSDLLVDQEQGYRETLLGLRRGLDCALLTQAVAQRCGRSDLAGFCGRWLDERRRLVAECERQVPWFAFHPQFAAARATSSRPGIRAPGPPESIVSRVP